MIFALILWWFALYGVYGFFAYLHGGFSLSTFSFVFLFLLPGVVINKINIILALIMLNLDYELEISILTIELFLLRNYRLITYISSNGTNWGHR